MRNQDLAFKVEPSDQIPTNGARINRNRNDTENAAAPPIFDYIGGLGNSPDKIWATSRKLPKLASGSTTTDTTAKLAA